MQVRERGRMRVRKRPQVRVQGRLQLPVCERVRMSVRVRTSLWLLSQVGVRALRRQSCWIRCGRGFG